MFELAPVAPQSVPETQASEKEQQCDRPARFPVGTLVGQQAEGLLEAAREAAREHASENGPAVWQLMRTDIVLLSAGMTLASVDRVFTVAGLRAAPVVDAARRPIGFLTRGDLMRLRREGVAPTTSVEDAMMCFTLAVPMQSPISRAAALMAYEGVSQVVVTGDGGRVVGMLSTMDLTRQYARDNGYGGMVAGDLRG